MKISPHPLEHELGMDWYADDHPGIGGRLRLRPEDFVVEEISDRGFEGGGKYLICRLDKRNWESQRAIKEISRALRISHRRIGWAGTKDRRACTSQLISIYDIDPEALERIRLPGIHLEPLGYSSEPIRLGDLLGNRFSITIRECFPEDLEERVTEIAATVRSGIPNYFGIQRFGVVRPITHRVGRAILRREYEEAVMIYIGEPFPAEDADMRAARAAFREERDPRRALASLPDGLRYERAMLNSLITHPGDFIRALQILPPKLLSLFVSAYQSYLFNRVLSARMEREEDFREPQPGDRLLFHDGRDDVVSSTTRPAARQHIKRGRCAIAILIPGGRPVTPTGEDDRLMQDLMDADGIDHRSFEEAARIVGTAFNGTIRQVSIAPEVHSLRLDGDVVRLEFSLPPGCYATTVSREFMKAPPEDMI